MVQRITVYPEGGKSVVLSASDHLATGGEGSVYAKGGQVFKIYLDAAKAQRAGMERKIEVLKRLARPGIAAPQAALRDDKGNFVGLMLPLVPAQPLCRAFTTGWRDANQFGPAQTAAVVDAMREITAYAHQGSALMVDANEMNWLLDGVQPTAIDVDSWQLPGFPATAIMPSIRDYSHEGFDEGSDWFAWAVVSFSLWTGLHPYKGTHPDFPKAALEARMRARASVFDPRVRLPPAARSVSDIPAPLRSWYERVFQGGERTAPPSAKASAVGTQTAPRTRVVQSLAGSLRLDRLGNAGGRILAAFNGFVIAATPSGLCLWDALRRAPVPQASASDLALVLREQAGVVRTGSGRAILALGAGKLRMLVLETGAVQELPSAARALWQSGNRIFGLVDSVPNGLHEYETADMGGRALVSVRHQWPVAALSTRFWRGGLLQDCLGQPFLGVLEGEGLLLAAAPQLRSYRVVDGFASGAACVWVSAIRLADGETVRLQLAHQAGRYEVVDETVVPDLDLDAASNAAGVAVLRDGADLHVTKARAQRRLAASGLPEEIRLFSMGPGGIGAFDGSEVVKLSLG